jgi:hypothetical protein
VTCWSALQLSWTLILATSQLWQVSRQVTTLEVSNLGRYGYMGGRGSSLRDQSGAMQATAVGAGVGPGADGSTTDGVHTHHAGCMQVLGLDRFTNGKALGGMKRAGRGQNPFDQGVIRVSTFATSLN